MLYEDFIVRVRAAARVIASEKIRDLQEILGRYQIAYNEILDEAVRRASDGHYKCFDELARENPVLADRVAEAVDQVLHSYVKDLLKAKELGVDITTIELSRRLKQITLGVLFAGLAGVALLLKK